MKIAALVALILSLLLLGLVVGNGALRIAELSDQTRTLHQQVAELQRATDQLEQQLQTLSAQVKSPEKVDEASEGENSPTGVVAAFVAAMAATDYRSAVKCIDTPKPDSAEQIEALFTRLKVDMSACPAITNLVEVDPKTETLAEKQGLHPDDGMTAPEYFRKIKASLKCPKGETVEAVVGVKRLSGNWKLRSLDADALLVLLAAGTMH